ncbi:MAG: DUF3455 domain-containing protein [Acidobacteriia bacterium]|nr:DUF3455 domain-containing protein [Terriglobia bacterium]
MKNIFRYFLAVGVVGVSLGSSVALAQTAAINGINVPTVPANLQVPEGNMVFLGGHAQGTQNYICLPSGGSFAWTFFSPQATLLFDYRLGPIDFKQQIITHFLSPNPVENGTGRATWQSSIDTSAVWAKVAPGGSTSDPAFVASGAIPWLLLAAVGTQRGPNGGDILANTTFVQRLNTAGGVAPSAGCSQASNVGATALVPYTADYFFYKAIPRSN